MRVTAEQAQKRWCPFALPEQDERRAHNRRRDGSPSEGSHCITVECMAWRWTNEEKHSGYCALGEKP